MSPFTANPFIFIFSIVAIAAIVLYFGYMAFDGIGLEVERSPAVVRDKQHVMRGETSVVTIIDGRPLVRSQETPEAFLLRLAIENTEVYAAVKRSFFEETTLGVTVNVRYQRRRLSGRLQVIEVSR